MIHAKGRYSGQRVDLDRALALPDGAEVEVLIRPVADAEREAWHTAGMERLEQEWDNPEDAIYDDWKNLYGV
jgi:hypothetical protein